MQPYYSLQEKGIRPIIKNALGLKIPKEDLEILSYLCLNNDIIKHLFSDNRSNLSDHSLVNKFRSYKKPDKSLDEAIVVNEKTFSELFSVTGLYRSTFGEEYNLTQFLNSKLHYSAGSNGSGVYFTENDPKYSIEHFKKSDENKSQSRFGHLFKVALNPESKVIDKIKLFEVQRDLITAVNNKQYADGEKIEFKCDKEVLVRMLQSDPSLIALMIGVSSVYVPFRNFTNQGNFGHFVMLNKNAAAVSKNQDSLDVKVDIQNLKNNPEQEKSIISEKLKIMLPR